MPKKSMHDDADAVNCEGFAGLSARATIVPIAGLWAAWFAAGSTGLLALPLQNALTWTALTIALVAGCYKRGQNYFPISPRVQPSPARENSSDPFYTLDGLILATAVVVGLVMLAVGQPVVGTLAVALVLAALARFHSGLAGRVILLAAFAALVLGVFRLLSASVPTVWLAANALGRAMGWLAGRISGEPLQIGATFAGVDFLVAMAVVYAGWIVSTPRPRLARAIYAAVAILTAQFAYLTILAHGGQLLALLPEVVVPQVSDINHVGVSTWGNAVRTLLPWNLPLLAAVFHTVVAVAMFRWAAWLAVAEPGPPEQRPRRRAELEGKEAAIDGVLQIGPVLLAVSIPLLTVVALGTSSLRGKTILAYDQGFLTWEKPVYDKADPPAARMFGMLPEFVASLGGKLVRSRELSAQELAAADVLLLIHPNRAWPDDRLQRIWQYVRGGGSLLVAAAPQIHEGDLHSSFNDVLAPTAMAVRDDTVTPAAEHWEQCYQATSHPAATGIDERRNSFGMSQASSIHVRWPAQPMRVGRFAGSTPGSDAARSSGTPYQPGEPLGDLVLAAEQSFGQGRVAVLGDSAPLSDDGSVAAYEFTGRLLGYLANKSSNPQAWWRQSLGLLAAGALIALLAWRADPLRLGLAAIVLSAALWACSETTRHAGRVLPDGRDHAINNVAYIDASHLEPYSDSTWDTFGLGRFQRTLMRNGYLPLLSQELTSECLERAGLLISIAPARPFSESERKAVHGFVAGGGTLVSMVGAEEAAGSSELLADFDFRVPASPVPPTETTHEPAPLGALVGDRPTMRFYAAWPIECTAEDAQVLIQGPQNTAVITRRPFGHGTVAVIGDTFFAVNENMGPTTSNPDDNPIFWRWLLSRVTNRAEWSPPQPSGENAPVEHDAPLEPDQSGGRP